MTIYDETDVNVTGIGAAGSNTPIFGGAGVTSSISSPSTVPLPPGNIVVATPEPTEGRKFDGGKLEYGLLPPFALEETVKVLTFGAQKYERGNWQRVPDAKRRYFDAMERHIWAWKKGEQIDPESGINHLAHAMCCLMFLYEHDIIDFFNNGDVNETI